MDQGEGVNSVESTDSTGKAVVGGDNSSVKNVPEVGEGNTCSPQNGCAGDSVPGQSEAELLSNQIAELVTVESTSQEKRLNDEVDSMLLKITEFMEVVEMIRSDTNICVISNLPLVTDKSKQLQETFDKIDALEVFVTHVDETLKKLEAQTEVAEAHYNTFSSLKKKIFGALSNIGRKHADTSLQHQTSRTGPHQPLETVEIFKTGDFFPPAATDDSKTLTESPALAGSS